MSRITLDHLTKQYGPITAVDNLSVTVESGTITGVIGANGAGKSTTFRMLLGLTRPTSGTARINGKSYVDLPRPARVVGALLDPDIHHPKRTGRDALRVLAAYSRVGDARVDELLDLVGLTDAAGRRVGGYSMGMRQRLGLAAALLGDPPTLVLDEPANGLDPVGIHWLRTFLRNLAAEGRTVLVSSHGLAELGQTVDNVIVLDRGTLVTHGPLGSLLAGHGSANLEDLFLDLLQKESVR